MYFFRFKLIFILLVAVNIRANAQSLKFLIPDGAVAQYAGSIGYFSAGVSYDLFPNKRGSLDAMYGFVPGNRGGVLHIAAAKFTYRPWSIGVKDWAKFYPLNPGAFISYTFHKDLSFKFPSGQYSHDYYYWSEAMRPHLSVSSEVEVNTDKFIRNTGIKAIGFYIEANTNDYYLINYLQNTSALKLNDIFLLGIGTRVKF